MDFSKSVQFYNYNDHLCVLEFEIEEVKFSRFKNAFSTDKYIDVCAWEHIMSKIYKFIDQIFDKNTWKSKKDEFRVNDLVVKIKAVSQEKGLANYEKLSHLEWILKIKINRASTIEDSCKIRERSSSLKSLSKSSESDENCIIDVGENESGPESKKIRIDKEGSSSKYNFKSRPKQSDLNRWLSTSGSDSKSSCQKMSKLKVLKATTSKDNKSTTPIESVDLVDAEQFKQMKEFVARAEQQELDKENRRKELKDYTILDCRNIENEEILEIIKSLKDQIDSFFNQWSPATLIFDNKPIKAIDITTSNILTQKQIINIMSAIENQRHPAITDEKILHDIAVPYVIIQIFKKKHNLSSKSALERIKLQEEKKILFKEGFNDSY